MAKRPVFIPDYCGSLLVEERIYSIEWAPGFAVSQKRKNILALHEEARRDGLDKVLEISSKSDDGIGRRLSAFNLKLDIDGEEYSLESVYQGCKVFERRGPFHSIFVLAPRKAKKHIRSLNCGRLIEFNLGGISYPLSPPNAFYDWLYIRSLAKHEVWIRGNISFDAFTDIEFNPAKQVNCQARAFAEYLSLLKRGSLQRAASDFDAFSSMLKTL